ncbi:MAG: hypothetical protein IKG18_08280 [Atopobiaceae bacterium]|nr:hypothetical protein [Atopobiaceae bacterium]
MPHRQEAHELFDSGVMGRVLDYAEVFYHKRFILEKELRVRSLAEGATFYEVVEEVSDVDTDAVVEEAERIVDEETETSE